MATTDRPEPPVQQPAVQPLDKAPDAFRTISEVAEDLDLPQHVLRFWETRFAQIKPLKRGGGRRYYRPDDVQLLRGIRRLLYGEGYTIKGVQKILRDQGLRYVASLGRGAAPEGSVQQGSGQQGNVQPQPGARAGEPPAPEGPHLYAPPAERALRAPQSPPVEPRMDAAPALPEDEDEDEEAIEQDDGQKERIVADRWDDHEDDEPAFDGPDIRVGPLSRPVPTGPVPQEADVFRSAEARLWPAAPPVEPRRMPTSVPERVVPQPSDQRSASPQVPPSYPHAPRAELGDFATGEEAFDPEEEFTADDAGSDDARDQAAAWPQTPEPQPAAPEPATTPEPASKPPSFPLAFGPPPLPEDAARKLRLLLDELAECRRLLDKAR